MRKLSITDYWARVWRIALAVCLAPGVFYLVIDFVSGVTEVWGKSLHFQLVTGNDTVAKSLVAALITLVAFFVVTIPLAIIFAALLAWHKPRPRDPLLFHLVIASILGFILLYMETVLWPYWKGGEASYFSSQAFGLLVGAIVDFQYGKTGRDIIPQADLDE